MGFVARNKSGYSYKPRWLASADILTVGDGSCVSNNESFGGNWYEGLGTEVLRNGFGDPVSLNPRDYIQNE